MRCAATLLIATMLVMTDSKVSAQATKPSFAGTWAVESASNGRGSLGRELTIVQTGGTLMIEYMTSGQNPLPRKLVYKLDGTESKNTVARGSGQAEETSKATWTGNTLVIATGERKLTLALESAHLVIVTSTSGFGPAPSRIVYKKTK